MQNISTKISEVWPSKDLKLGEFHLYSSSIRLHFLDLIHGMVFDLLFLHDSEKIHSLLIVIYTAQCVEKRKLFNP